ncbi:hypothetical protein T439DRAFT_311538 [Meredithblackwellia eburnea MCA 4105]
MARGESLRTRLRLLRNQEPLACVLYSLVQPSSTVSSTWIASISEYRFPHPILTTAVHLVISIVTLLAVSLVAKSILSASVASSKRKLTSPNPGSTSILQRIISLLASHTPTRQHLAPSHFLSPSFLAASIAAVLASLVQTHASRVTEPQFWSLVKLLPLGITIFTFIIPHAHPLALEDATSSHASVAAAVWLILLAGPDITWTATKEAWVCAVLHSVCVVGWVLSLKSAMKESERETDTSEEGRKPSLTIFHYLLLSLLLLIPPLITSDEISNALSSGHFGFFTEPGFWIQELVMAWCGLASLGVFWSMTQVTNPLILFTIVSLKDYALPYVYHHIFGNPFPFSHFLPAILRPKQQILALLVLGVVIFAESNPGLGNVVPVSRGDHSSSDTKER